MATGSESAEQERFGQRLDPECGGARLWFRRCQAFNWQRRSVSFHRHCRRPAFNRDGRGASCHRNVHRAALHRECRRRDYFYLGEFREPGHPSGQHFAAPVQTFCQSFLVGQRFRRLEKRCQRECFQQSRLLQSQIQRRRAGRGRGRWGSAMISQAKLSTFSY